MTVSGSAGSPTDAASSGPGGAPGGPQPYDVPAPPPGPGAVPPFVVPPSEGRTARMWIGLGVAALAVVLCCGGGLSAVVGLAVASNQAAKEQGRAVVTDYLDAVTHRDYGKAYNRLCDRLQRQETLSEFEQQVGAEPQIASYHVHNMRRDAPVVPVDVTYAGGTRNTLQFQLEQDRNTGELEICGIS